jgi:hypothetical protein
VSKLLDLIRQHKAIRSGADSFMVVHIQSIFCNDPPHTRIGTNLIEQAHDEPFDAFEARAIAAARSAGNTVVSITLPRVDKLATAASEKVDVSFWEKHPDTMTDAELLATIAVGTKAQREAHSVEGIHRITDAEIAALTPKPAAK